MKWALILGIFVIIVAIVGYLFIPTPTVEKAELVGYEVRPAAKEKILLIDLKNNYVTARFSTDDFSVYANDEVKCCVFWAPDIWLKGTTAQVKASCPTTDPINTIDVIIDPWQVWIEPKR